MHQAIIQKSHGRKGAQLVPIPEALDKLLTISRLFNRPYRGLVKEFEKSGYNVFNLKWKQFINSQGGLSHGK